MWDSEPRITVLARASRNLIVTQLMTMVKESLRRCFQVNPGIKHCLIPLLVVKCLVIVTIISVFSNGLLEICHS
jgi:hypothetical protein